MKLRGKCKKEKDESETLVMDNEEAATAVLEAETPPPETADSVDSVAAADEPVAAAAAPEGAPEPAGDTASPAEPELLDDLMDIFTSEEEEDAELSSMTEDLEEISMEALLSEARDVAVRMREAASP